MSWLLLVAASHASPVVPMFPPRRAVTPRAGPRAVPLYLPVVLEPVDPRSFGEAPRNAPPPGPPALRRATAGPTAWQQRAQALPETGAPVAVDALPSSAVPIDQLPSALRPLPPVRSQRAEARPESD